MRIRSAAALAAMILHAAPAFAGTTADIAYKSCLTELKMSQSACTCVGKKAESELSTKQQKMFIAMITKDTAKMGQLQGAMSMKEMTQLAQFMTATPQSCKSQ